MQSRRIIGGEQANLIAESDSWFKTDIDSMYIGYEYPIAIQLPLPTTQELIELLFSSSYDDEVIGACLLLKDNEACEQMEFRQELLDELKKSDVRKLSAGQKKRIARIITLTELNHAENRREVIGKSIKEVERDYNDFSEMALKAENILKQTRPNLLERFLNRIGMRTAK
tara:strand:- start:15 stop:524 length:510 start_codon:yes stop_codon:yes gene_type:complete